MEIKPEIRENWTIARNPASPPIARWEATRDDYDGPESDGFVWGATLDEVLEQIDETDAENERRP